MQDQIKRPLVVWITQIGLLLWGLMMLPATADAIAYSWDKDLSFRLPINALFLGILPLAAFAALAKRAQFARELAMLSLICLWVYLIHALMSSFGPSSGMSMFPRHPKALLLFVLIVVPVCSLPVLFFKLGYGKKAAAFFTRS
jgi:hypothetical protein